MAGLNAIQILRGTSSTLNSSTQTLLPGQLVYNKDKNYLAIGSDNVDRVNKLPIVTNEIIGYDGDDTSITDTMSVEYSINRRQIDIEESTPQNVFSIYTSTIPIQIILDNTSESTQSEILVSNDNIKLNEVNISRIITEGVLSTNIASPYDMCVTTNAITASGTVAQSNINIYSTKNTTLQSSGDIRILAVPNTITLSSSRGTSFLLRATQVAICGYSYTRIPGLQQVSTSLEINGFDTINLVSSEHITFPQSIELYTATGNNTFTFPDIENSNRIIATTYDIANINDTLQTNATTIYAPTYKMSHSPSVSSYVSTMTTNENNESVQLSWIGIYDTDTSVDIVNSNTQIPTCRTVRNSLPTINGELSNSSTSIYAPTSNGATTQFLCGSGNSATAPTWVNGCLYRHKVTIKLDNNLSSDLCDPVSENYAFPAVTLMIINASPNEISGLFSLCSTLGTGWYPSSGFIRLSNDDEYLISGIYTYGGNNIRIRASNQTYAFSVISQSQDESWKTNMNDIVGTLIIQAEQ